MGKRTEQNETEAVVEDGEKLALETWLAERGLEAPKAALLRVLYPGQKRTREEWERALEEALARPVKV